MNLKVYWLALAFAIEACSTLVFADNIEDYHIMLPPDKPVCTEKTCPYTITKNNDHISINCLKIPNSTTDYNCILAASNGSITATQDLADHLDANLNFSWLTPNLLEITDYYEQGTAAYYDKRYLFIDFKTMQVSSVFFNIYASNLKKMVVLAESAVTQDQTPIPTIYIMPIFNSEQAIAITRGFAGFFTHRIYPQPITHFLDNGNLVLVYRSDQHKNVTEIIPVDYAKLDIKANS